MRKILTRYLILAFVLCTFIAAPLTVYAVEDDIKITKSGNEYRSSEEKLTVSNQVKGDLVAASGEVRIEGDVEDNLITAGGGILVNGDIKNDVFIAGGYIVINGNIEGDVRIAGGEVYINSNYIDGDVMIAAGKVSVAEGVTIRGEKDIYSGQQSENVTDNPVDLSNYNPDKQGFSFGSNSDFSGLITFFTGAAIVLSIILKLVMIIGGIIAGYLVLRLFPVLSENALETMKKRSIPSLLVGMATYFVAPFLALFLLISVIGIKVLFVLMLFGAIAIYLSGAYSSYAIGRWIFIKLGWDKSGRLMPLITGMLLVELVLLIISLVPFIGDAVVLLIRFVLTSWALGAILINKYNGLRRVEATVNTKTEKVATKKKK